MSTTNPIISKFLREDDLLNDTNNNKLFFKYQINKKLLNNMFNKLKLVVTYSLKFVSTYNTHIAAFYCEGGKL